MTEKHWSDPNKEGGIGGYAKSKTLAEKAAWDYHANLLESQRFELVVLNPCFIMGPSICSGDGTSEAFMKKYVDGSIEKIPSALPYDNK